MFYLINNDKLIKKSNNYEELIQDIIEMNLIEPYYNIKINNIDNFWKVYDTHEGCTFPYNTLLDINKNINNVVIIKDFYLSQYYNEELLTNN